MASWWRGRPIDWNPDRQALEQERQRWVMEKLTGENEVVQELSIDPDRAYREWREVFERTGYDYALRMMLEYVRD